MQIFDGTKFWNPYEGLGVAADLIKLAHSWMESGQVKDMQGPNANASAALQDLERRARGIRPLVKFSVQEWNGVRVGKRNSPNLIRIKDSDAQTISEVRRQVEQIQAAIANSSGALRLQGMAISYPRGEIHFTTDSYFDFVFRSLDEILLLTSAGKLAGPKPDQMF